MRRDDVFEHFPKLSFLLTEKMSVIVYAWRWQISKATRNWFIRYFFQRLLLIKLKSNVIVRNSIKVQDVPTSFNKNLKFARNYNCEILNFDEFFRYS